MSKKNFSRLVMVVHELEKHNKLTESQKQNLREIYEKYLTEFVISGDKFLTQQDVCIDISFISEDLMVN